MSAIRSQPCSACPYRRDCPSGVWAAVEYEKLRDYDAPTAEQPMAPFGCHATPEHLCHGWAVVHTSRGHEHDLLALRIAGGPEVPPPGVPLFDSGNEAADHGQADVDAPSADAMATADRLVRKHPRLREGIDRQRGSDAMTADIEQLPEATVPSGGIRSAWEGHERQYPRTGVPGIAYWRGKVNIGDVTSRAANAIIGRVWYEPDCLLYRSRKGTLVGVLQYFPEPAPMDLERRGAVNVFVHPRRQRRGIALALVAEADRRWAIDWQDQKYTPEGRALLEHYLRGAG